MIGHWGSACAGTRNMQGAYRLQTSTGTEASLSFQVASTVLRLPMQIPRACVWANERYVLLVALCKITHADALAEGLKQKHFRTKEEVVGRMRDAAHDDDIETGASTLRLTCPLTYMRMKMPCRADACDHVQCFDALSFYAMNEQSPQWLCPVCNRHLMFDDLRVDGYVEDILQRTPYDLEAVLVESDGSWHSTDNAYNSETAAVLPPAPDIDTISDSASTPPAKEENVTPDVFMAGMDEGAMTAAPQAGAGVPHNTAVPGTGTPPMASTRDTSAATLHTDAGPGTMAGSSPPPPPADVIDLTFSSDDE